MKPSLYLSEVQKELRSGRYTCVELVQYYLDNIHRQASLNLFLEVFEEEVLAKAAELDRKIQSNSAGKLAGLVLGIKDVFSYKDHSLQASSKILSGFKAQFNATVIDRLLQEDVLIIGRQNCDEFAMGSSNENSFFSPSLNPHDPERVPGGSSGASAAALAANMCLASLGSDTGGSVRQPASFCGVWGLKPSYGRLSRHGLIAYASSFDCPGILAQDAHTLASMLEVMAGPDDFDSTLSQKEVEPYSSRLSPKKQYKLAYFKESLQPREGLDPEVRAAFFAKVEDLKKAGHEVKALDFPILDYLLPVYYILTTAEASSNLGRYDGIRYGFRSSSDKVKKFKDLAEMYRQTRSEGFGEEVKKRILLGTFVLSADYYNAYYTKAQKMRRLISEASQKVLKEYDFILSPTSPGIAFKLGAHREDPLAMYLEDIYTVHANVVGIPAISVPIASHSKNLPIGMQIMGDFFQEAELLAFSKLLVGE